MNINHHLSDAFLLDYAAGNLSEGWSLAVATHLALCPACRRQLDAMEGAAGALLEKIPVEAGASEDSWERMKTRIGGLQAIEIKPEPPREKSKPAILPDPLRSYVGGDLPDLKWRALGRGAYQILIDTGDRDTQVRLLRIPAGKPVPEHSHEGYELTLVLAGSFRDGKDVFARGDIEEADDTLLHQPVATEEEDYICLAVTQAPPKFTSWIVRLMQPILKI